MKNEKVNKIIVIAGLMGSITTMVGFIMTQLFNMTLIELFRVVLAWPLWRFLLFFSLITLINISIYLSKSTKRKREKKIPKLLLFGIQNIRPCCPLENVGYFFEDLKLCKECPLAIYMLLVFFIILNTK